MDRKSFLRNSGRWTLMALLAGLVWFLFRNREMTSSGICAENQFCSNCNKFGSCSLPQAKEQA